MRKETQSFKLFKLLRGGKTVTLARMAKSLKVDPSSVSSYVAELVRVYGAAIEHTPRTREWRMTNAIMVPPGGVMGRKVSPAKSKTKPRRAQKH